MFDVLENLELRAGPSDQDREAWLEFRRSQGVTATEAAKLYRSPAYAKTLRDLKNGGEDSFKGNRYTEWGSAREPFIAERAGRFGFEAETRVFKGYTNERHLASPDLWMVDFDGNLVLGEIKTSKHALTERSETYNKSVYYEQMQWQMHVMGARECWFFWEQHDDNWPTPKVIAADHFVVPYDPVTVEGMITVVDEFLDPEADPTLIEQRALLASFAEWKRREGEAKQELEVIAERLRELNPEGGSVENEFWTLSVAKPGKPGSRFDSTRFKKEHPDLAKDYSVATEPGKQRVALKAKDMEVEDETVG